ncbi:MAG: hypothetical protein KGH79_03915, partial [Patescibacteria group bacterium]|nr:hypothetical protein [Patescibacteria group bacterium]
MSISTILNVVIIAAIVVIIAAVIYGLLQKSQAAEAQDQQNPQPAQPQNDQPERSWHLKNLSSKEIRRIGKSYQLKISGKAGNTKTRIAVWVGFEFFVLLLLLIPIYATSGSHLPFWTLGIPVAGIWAVIVFASTWKFFLVVVPKLGALIVTSITGRMHVFKPGWGIRFPWETYTENLDDISQRAKKV